MQTLLKINGGFMKASDFLEAGIQHLSDRAATYLHRESSSDGKR